jgi:hypothetical protein
MWEFENVKMVSTAARAAVLTINICQLTLPPARCTVRNWQKNNRGLI